jgi:tight adherence protein C
MTGLGPAGAAALVAIPWWMAGVVLARRAVPLRRAASASSARDAGVARRTPRGSRPVRAVASRSGPLLVASGWAMPPTTFARVRIGAAVGGFVLGCVLPGPGVLLAPVLALFGSRVPSILAGRSAARRRAAIDADVPQLLDLLAAASSAGLSAQVGVRRAIEALHGPLAAELGTTVSRVDLGARWREELDDLVERSGSADLRRTVGVLVRTETLGVSLEESTAELAASVRAARRVAITERARTAPVKMLFPLVFLVLPAFLLLTVVPVLLTTLRSIR